jgi:hypothetical protein
MGRIAGLASESGKNAHEPFEQAEEAQSDAGSFHTVEEPKPIAGRPLWLADLTFQKV